MQEYVLPLCVLLAFVFYQLRNAETNTLLAIIIVGVGAALVFVVMPASTKTASPSPPPDTEHRKEAVSANFPVKKFGQMKFLPGNGVFQDIAKDIRFIRIFDKARYGDILLHMEHLQKVYMYILGDRYDAKTHIPIFRDLRASVLEMLYGLVHIVPQTLKHTYGVDPYAIVEKNIADFTAITRKMLGVLHAYCADQGVVCPDLPYEPYEPGRDRVLP